VRRPSDLREVGVRILKWLVLGLALVVGLAFAAWWFVLRSDPEPRAAIIETPTTTPTTVAGTTGSPLDGTWNVAPGNRRNFVGYRVTEKLVANISETEATGRTHDVTASMTVDGTTVKDVTVTADLRTLESGNSFRDGRLRGSAIESDQFPEAKFVLTQPIALAAQPAVGATITVEATGDFTLHGVTRQVTIEMQGRYDGETVQVVGHLPILFSDYGITAPTAPAVASVDDRGEMELQLFFVKS
jgi:polyisoprenoid-binding protein YceI